MVLFTPCKLEMFNQNCWFFFFAQIVSFENFPTHHCPPTWHTEIALVKDTNDHKVAKSNTHFCWLFIWSPSHIWYHWTLFFFFSLKMLPSVGLQDSSVSWFPGYFTGSFFPGSLTHFISQGSKCWMLQGSIHKVFLSLLSVYTYSLVISFMPMSLNTLHILITPKCTSPALTVPPISRSIYQLSAWHHLMNVWQFKFTHVRNPTFDYFLQIYYPIFPISIYCIPIDCILSVTYLKNIEVIFDSSFLSLSSLVWATIIPLHYCLLASKLILL